MAHKIKFFKDLTGKFEETLFQYNTLLLDKKAINKHEIANAVLVQNANKRTPNASTLTKAQVRGGGKKPYKQKHTGKARQGSIRNPHYVGGGRAFGPKPEKKYFLKQNKKAYRLAFKSAFTLRMHAHAISMLHDELKLVKPSTKIIVNMLKTINWKNQKILFVLKEFHLFLYKSCNNIPKVNVKLWNCLSVSDLLHYDQTIIQAQALKTISEVFV